MTAFPGPFGKPSAFLAAAFLVCMVASLPAGAGTTGGGWTRSSVVTDNVVNNGDGTWTYRYKVNNTSQQDGGRDQQPILVDWELPWFGDAGITNILSPRNWAHSVETIGQINNSTGWGGVAAWQNPLDAFYAGPGSPFTTGKEVLHWYNVCWAQARGDNSFAAVNLCDGAFDNAVFPDNSLEGFSFVADFDKTASPYQASWDFLPVRTGDPAFPLGGIPNSPAVRGIVQAVPEPGVLGLLAAGLAALVLSRRRRAFPTLHTAISSLANAGA